MVRTYGGAAIRIGTGSGLLGTNLMKVGLIGAGRNRNGIGEFIGKYLQRHGADVVAVVGSRPETANKAAAGLAKYGITAAPHVDLAAMVTAERPEAVTVASPFRTHADYVRESIDMGLHVLCEKPFIWHDTDDVLGLTDAILGDGGRLGLTIAMNSQWPFSLPYYERCCGPVDLDGEMTFYMRLSPIDSGREMLLDAVPHAMSVLYSVLGEGEVRNARIVRHPDRMIVEGSYINEGQHCAITIELIQEAHQPREFSFGFNDKVVRRVVDMENYDIYFSYKNVTVPVPDPLELSVCDFIGAVNRHRKPKIGTDHIRNNMRGLVHIWNAGAESGKGMHESEG